MSDINQIVNAIKEEITSPEPSKNRIIKDFYDLRNLLWKNLSKFYEIVGETFTLDPEFFMESIYEETRFFHNREMAKYIIEKFCLYEGEQILFEFKGDIEQVEDIKRNIRVSVKGGTIFVTNYRIIAQGTSNIKGSDLLDTGLVKWSQTLKSIGNWVEKRNLSKWAKSGESIVDTSLGQELPCYGYQFERRNLGEKQKRGKDVRYSVVSENVQNMIGVSKSKQLKALRKAKKIITITPSTEQIDELFEILNKDIFPQDVIQQVSRQIKSQEREGITYCVYCGQENRENFKYCIECGKPM